MMKGGFSSDKRNSRARLGAAFHNDLLEDWLLHGKAAIVKLRKDDPAGYARLVGSMVKTLDFQVTHIDEDMRAVRSREELFELLRERGGESAVSGFQNFLDHLGHTKETNVIELRPIREIDDGPESDGAA